ncbi:hypothetical protein H8959_019805 [Pygathrix nigripes]
MFSCSEQSDPIQALRKLTELCHLWLRPDLHTKEQILDMLVMEQFMISMPQELQVLVKVNGVQNCKDLEDLLRNHRRPKKWEEDFLLPETIVMKGGPKTLRPKPTLEKGLNVDREENPGLTSPEPQLPNGPTDLVRAKEGKEPPQRASVENVDADTPSACVVEREASTHSVNSGEAPNLSSSKPDATSISQEEPQGGATPVGNRESPGQAEINPVHSPGPASPASHPNGQEAKALLSIAHPWSGRTTQDPFQLGLQMAVSRSSLHCWIWMRLRSVERIRKSKYAL